MEVTFKLGLHRGTGVGWMMPGRGGGKAEDRQLFCSKFLYPQDAWLIRWAGTGSVVDLFPGPPFNNTPRRGKNLEKPGSARSMFSRATVVSFPFRHHLLACKDCLVSDHVNAVALGSASPKLQACLTWPTWELQPRHHDGTLTSECPLMPRSCPGHTRLSLSGYLGR